MSGNNTRILKFLKEWMLVIAMIAGASSYLIYHRMESWHPAGPVLEKVMETVQPSLLFLMLFLTFCTIRPSDLRPQKWHLWLLLLQGGLFVLPSLILILFPGITGRIGLETAMICMICPTATACAVVTGKLGGNMAGVMTYTVFINLLVSILIPLMVPLTNPMSGMNFMKASSMILAKVFPMLIMPCLLAWLVRYAFPGIHSALLRHVNLSFYIWALALTFAIAMSTRYIIRNEDSSGQLLLIAFSSLACCAFQFWAGKRIGARYGEKITAGQSLGQKNTVFAIWMGYTFMTPIASVAGGFYSIWHNCFNTWQLHHVYKEKHPE